MGKNNILFGAILTGLIYLIFLKWRIIFLQNAVLELHSGYKAADLEDCVSILHDFLLSRQGDCVIMRKYDQHKVCISYHYTCLIGLDYIIYLFFIM